MISISVDVIVRCHIISTQIKLPVCPPPIHEHFVKMSWDDQILIKAGKSSVL